MKKWCSILLLAGLSLTHQSKAAQRMVIIDQDAMGPATSDLQSVLMVIQDPNVDVLGITVVSGDGWRDEEVAHTLRLLELIGRTDIPVVPGAVYPLINSAEATQRWEVLYGKLVYKGAWNERGHAANFVPSLPEGQPSTRAANEDAAHFLIRNVRAHPDEVSILALGPLTDLALAARIDPQFAVQARELVVMGGSLEPQDNGTVFAQEYAYTPRLEFNFRWDPEAAHIVLSEAWRKITEVPVDPTTMAYFTAELKAEIAQGHGPVAKYVATYGRVFPMWDELAAAAWLDPKVVTKSASMLVDVDTSFTAGYGNTLTWPVGKGPGLDKKPVQVVQKVDVAELNRLFVQAMKATKPGTRGEGK